MLEELKVVELSTHIAAPAAAGMLADWGADVTKIEWGGGDPMRLELANLMPDRTAPVFHLDNRGKRSIRLDPKSDLGKEVILRLIRRADVFITNRRPAALASHGLDWERVRVENSRLVYASVTGYGSTGPDAGLPGYDVAAFWSRAAVASLLIPKGQEPFVLRTGLGDHTCALATVSGILAALLKRAATGEGQFVETSLLRSGVYAVGADIATYLRLGKIKGNRPRKEALAPLVNFFRTKDGRWVCVMPRNARVDWPNISAAAGRPELVDDPRFETDQRRQENVEALITELDAGFGELDYADVAQRLRALDVVFSPVQSAAELVADPQAEAAGCFVELLSRDGETFRNPASPVRFAGEALARRRGAPDLGEHSREILEELEFSGSEIEHILVQASPGQAAREPVAGAVPIQMPQAF